MVHKKRSKHTFNINWTSLLMIIRILLKIFMLILLLKLIFSYLQFVHGRSELFLMYELHWSLPIKTSEALNSVPFSHWKAVHKNAVNIMINKYENFLAEFYLKFYFGKIAKFSLHQQ